MDVGGRLNFDSRHFRVACAGLSSGGKWNYFRFESPKRPHRRPSLPSTTTTTTTTTASQLSLNVSSSFSFHVDISRFKKLVE
jgi:hypothetical protein